MQCENVAWESRASRIGRNLSTSISTKLRREAEGPQCGTLQVKLESFLRVGEAPFRFYFCDVEGLGACRLVEFVARVKSRRFFQGGKSAGFCAHARS